MAENEWELSKENVLPLRQGRKTSHLTPEALQPHLLDQPSVKQQRMAFETELRTYGGDDPLDVWDRYIQWTEQNFPKGGLDSHLQEILQMCVREFKDDDRYKNDPRYLAIWIKFAKICTTPLEIYSFMFDNKIGYELASFYDAWASELEIIGNVKKADMVYSQGMSIRAEPLDLLPTKQSELQARVARRVAGEVVDAPEPVAFVEDPKRTTLGALKAHGSRGRIPVDRSLARTSNFQTSSTVQTSSNKPPSMGFAIFDENAAAPPSLPNPSGQWNKVPSKENNKENEKSAGVWTQGRVKQRHVPAIDISEVSNVIRSEFTVHTDENVDQPPATPKVISPFDVQPLSAKKPQKFADPFQQVQMRTREDPKFQPMYCKYKIYNGAFEFTFEELRAGRWLERQKRLKEQQLQEEMRQREALLARQQEMLQKQQQEFEQQKLEMLRRQREHEEQLKLQKEVLDLERMNLGQHNRTVSSSNQYIPQENVMQGLPEMRPELSFGSGKAMDTSGYSLRPGSVGSVPSNNSSTLLNSFCSKDSAGNMSNVTPSTLSNTFNMSSKGSAKSTPSFSGKLTAPSPTINTKQAMSAVLGMFNDTMQNNQFGWSRAATPQSKDASMDSVPNIEKDNTAAGFGFASGAPFQIYEEVDTKTDACAAAPQNPPNDPARKRALSVQEVNCEESGSSCPPVSSEIEMVEDDAIVAEQKQWATKLEALENLPDDITFNPGFSSTCNFSNFHDAARLASTPFNPGGTFAPLQNLPMSNIKAGPSKSINDSETKRNDAENTNITMGDQFSRRSSVYSGSEGVKELSPIIERSEEDLKSTTGSSSSSSHYDPSNNTVASLRSRAPSGPGSLSGLSGISAISESKHEAPSQSTNNSVRTRLRSETQSDYPLADLTCHEIDVRDYVPKDEGPDLLNMSVAIDPHDPFDEDCIQEFLSRLPQPLSTDPHYHEINRAMPRLAVGDTLQLGSHSYYIKAKLGSGAFGKIFTVQRDDQSNNEVIKVQKPAWPWEFYICKTLHERLSKLDQGFDVRLGVMSISEGFFFSDGSMMCNSLHEYGTLLDFVNGHRKRCLTLDPCLVLLLVIDMLNLLEQMHKCHIIHGDFKPDNLLVTQIPTIEGDPEDFLRTHSPCVKLIDFGRSIDMKMYPEGTTFMAKVKTSGFACVEMKTNRPWTYQTDLFGFIATVHVLLLTNYMNVIHMRGTWKTTSSLKRFSYAASVWHVLFDNVLNIPSCNELPDLANYRKQLEAEFLKLIKVGAFNKLAHKLATELKL